MQMEKLYGLIGYPLSHSFSAGFFAAKFEKENIRNVSYQNFPIKVISGFRDLLKKHPALAGLNVTIPFKEKIIPLLDELSPEAESIGAVNTVKIIRTGEKIKTIGFNTDVTGFEKSLDVNDAGFLQKALILGTGGASKAAAWVLEQRKTHISFATRNPQSPRHISYDQISGAFLNEFDLVVNTTPLGMYPDVDTFPPLPYEELNGKQVFFDLIYNPQETLFLLKAANKNCKTINGVYMLEKQAESSWEIWNDNNY
jgi:shikimate dehydrogenase